jgi:hypothetical protein
MKRDLTLLYSQLGLKPDCSLAELQLAYRRRISELQPNHLEPGSQSPESSALLRNLIWLYATASRFHRRYGRLPGAAAGRMASESPSAAVVSHAYSATVARPYVAAYQHVPSRDRPAAPSRIAIGLSFLLVILMAGLLLWWVG